jgi:predicted RNA-binding Zn ribbon-like protein
MSPTPEHLAVAFANTLSSAEHDRIATLEEFREWARPWPPLSRLAVDLPAAALASIGAQRDATQSVLHLLAGREPVPPETLRSATQPGLGGTPFELVHESAGIGVIGEPASVIRHLLGRAAIDLVIGPHVVLLRRCAGSECRKVFLAQRPDRRWCDSRICGNRERVAAHARRRTEAARPRPGHVRFDKGIAAQQDSFEAPGRDS